MWTNIKRILRSGFIQFWRSSFVSISSIFVMVITLAVITSSIFVNAILERTLSEIRGQVDVNVYFAPQAEEASVFDIREELESLPEVAEVTYVSRDQALADFRLRHQNDSTIIQSLEEIGDNPLGAILNVRAVQPDQYESIAAYLNDNGTLTNEGLPIIERVSYEDSKTAIDRLSRIIDAAEQFGVGILAVLVTLSIIITFNTIRLAIYISREEISVMRLVGASNKYIRGPFVVTGVICGVVASAITLVLFYPIAYWIGGQTAGFFSGFNIFEYYISRFGFIFIVVLTSAICMGAISSWLAVRKYLR
ncbi:MAG TPA: permease-like cell division protein FtsX [Candidatus Paceibacterota bacterium]|nr:permease-like cell division protein FtsX [Candidatus Paceibacterota bacterium]